MAITIPKTVPAEVVAGTVLIFERTYDDFDTTFSAVFLIANSGATAGTATGTATSGAFRFELTQTQTGTMTAGDYGFQITVSTGSGTASRSYLAERGSIKVLAAVGIGVDGRSHAKKTLDALEATLLGKASLDQLSYSIAGRTLQRMSPEELIRWRDFYRREYQVELDAERIARGLPSRRIVRVRMP